MAVLPERFRFRRAPRWWQEVAFILCSYWLYSIVRNGVPTRTIFAMDHAADVLAVERALGLDVERPINQWVAGVDWLAVASNYFYAIAHFTVTIGVLVWMYRRHPLSYRVMRTPLYVANLVALLGYWLYPLAPPRMLEGYVDTIVVFETWGSWASADVAAASNQFAAMPSMHFGWALWCGVVIFQLARRPWVRALGVAYPVTVLFVIVGTANHFWLDAAGGVVVLAAGALIGFPLAARVERRRARAESAAAAAAV